MAERPVEQLEELLRTYYPVAARLDVAIERTKWLEEAVQGVLARKLPRDIPKGWKWQQEKLTKSRGLCCAWIENQDPNSENVWVLVLPPGELVLAHWADEKVSAQLGKELGARPHAPIDGFYSGAHEGTRLASLLAVDEVEALRHAGDVGKVRERVFESLSAYFRLVR